MAAAPASRASLAICNERRKTGTMRRTAIRTAQTESDSFRRASGGSGWRVVVAIITQESVNRSTGLARYADKACS